MKYFSLAIAPMTVALGASAGTITTSSIAPTTDVLVSNPAGDVFTNTFADDSNSRGQGFSSGAGMTIDAITVRHDSGGGNPPAAYNFTLRVYDVTGLATTDFIPTAGTELSNETYAVTDNQISNADYVTFDLASSINVAASRQVHFILTHSGSGGFQFEVSDTSAFADGLLSVNGTRDNGNSPLQDFHFYVQGTAVPEPTSLALLGMGGLCMVKRRRR